LHLVLAMVKTAIQTVENARRNGRMARQPLGKRQKKAPNTLISLDAELKSPLAFGVAATSSGSLKRRACGAQKIGLQLSDMLRLYILGENRRRDNHRREA
jgi:hypothetical protein